MSHTGKELSNPYSTGGGGIHFENRVQASFVVLMLTGGFSPCLPTWPIQEIKLQGKYLGYDTDDLIITTKQFGQNKLAKLLGQIKHSISITNRDKTFGEVIQAAWRDFNNTNVFNEETDAIALITGPLSATDTIHVRTLLGQAQHSKNAVDFKERISLAKFTSEEQRKKLEVFKNHLKAANNNTSLTDDQLFRFLKRFHLLIYDLDIKGVTYSLLHSLIGQYSSDRTEELLALIEKEITYKSENAGSITIENIPDKIKSAFIEPIVRTIPNTLIEFPLTKNKPEWNAHEYASSLAITNLLGAWNEKSDADKDIIIDITKGDFLDWISKLREILQNPESPLEMKNGVWNVRKRSELWAELGPRIFDDTLDVFKNCAVTVLTERDPKFTLPLENRIAASIYGKVLKHSDSLREGIAESLALLQNNSNALTNCAINKPEIVSTLVVREIFVDADWMLWGSLNKQHPLLAEAAPDEFLSAMERALQQSPCPFDLLFEQEGDGITGENYLTGILWALETLAWDERYLVRVSVILGELASRDPGGNWGNRPSNSLVTIFLPWFPQTNASIIKRKVAIQTLTQEFPETAWKLLLKLLPNQHQTSIGSHKPKWRLQIPEDNNGVSGKNYWEQVSIYSELAVNMAENDINKLTELITYLDHLPPESFEKVLKYVSSTHISGKPENERVSLWTSLVKFSLTHKRFADASWALENKQVERIEKIAEQIAPENPLYLYNILFSDRDSDLFEEKGNWSEQKQHLEKRRQSAIREIYGYGGIDAVYQFAVTVESPNTVGYSLGFILEKEIDNSILPELLNTKVNKLSQFARAFVWGRQNSKGWEWVNKISVSGWSLGEIGQFLAWLPFTFETWEKVRILLGENEEEYWQKVNVNPFQADSNLEIAVDKLMEYNRPNSAIFCLYKTLHENQHLDKSRVVKALLSAINSNEPSYSSNVYYITELIKALQEDPSTNQNELFQIEWAYLPVLDRYKGASPKLLENQLSTDPVFFTQVIGTVYRSKKDVNIDKEPTESQKAVAENAYGLLSEWKTPPGSKHDGSFSGDAFKEWLENTKKLCRESGHLEVALSHIGRVLFYSPRDLTTGLWINSTVAKELNALNAEGMREGFRISVINTRGVQWVDPTGKPEKELAESYRSKAEDVENAGYFRFAATLNEIADSYEREAERIVNESRPEI